MGTNILYLHLYTSIANLVAGSIISLQNYKYIRVLSGLSYAK